MNIELTFENFHQRHVPISDCSSRPSLSSCSRTNSRLSPSSFFCRCVCTCMIVCVCVDVVCTYILETKFAYWRPGLSRYSRSSSRVRFSLFFLRCVCECVCVWLCVCVWICVYIHTGNDVWAATFARTRDWGSPYSSSGVWGMHRPCEWVIFDMDKACLKWKFIVSHR